MANFSEAYIKLCELEFSNKPEKFLHRNEGENGYTLGGIYQVANPSEFNWEFIEKIVSACAYDLERASVMLYQDENTTRQVFSFFKKYYWDRIHLDTVFSQVQAENIFFSGVHIGVRGAVMLAQKVVQTEEDGYLGEYTLKALNFYDDTMFKTAYDKLEIENYENLIQRNPNLSWAKQGFINRAYFA